jgi:putative transposase
VGCWQQRTARQKPALWERFGDGPRRRVNETVAKSCVPNRCSKEYSPRSRPDPFGGGSKTASVANADTSPYRRTHKARLVPNRLQAAALDSQGHAARALWNLLHEWYTCRNGGIARRPFTREVDRQLREARTNPLPGWEWLSVLPAQATQQVLKQYLVAWERFSHRVSEPPKFKKRGTRLAVDIPQASALKVSRLNSHWGAANIPLVGRVKFRWTHPLPVSPSRSERITGARLVKDSLGWHICFRIDGLAAVAPPNLRSPVGIDRGVTHTIALSDGKTLDMPCLLSPGEQRRLRGLERKAARQHLAHRRRREQDPNALPSKRQRHTREQIAALRARQARRRNDWLHKTTTDLAKSHGVVVVEDLRIRNLTRSARGTIERPGRNVRAKTGLNRSILGMAWGRIELMLRYKCPEHGGVLMTVDPRNSSIECSRCGHSSSTNRPNHGTFRCVVCRHAANADTNAAQVLLQRGLTALSGATPGCGGTAREARLAVLHREPLLAFASPGR